MGEKAEYRIERILVAVRADSAITLNDLREKLRLPACVVTTNAETTYVTPETLQTKPDNPQGFEMRPTSSGAPHPVSLFDNHE